MSFNALALSAPLLKAIEESGYHTPSPIQAQAIPPILAGHDLMAAAQTGTGKTAGFTLPLLDRLANGQPAKGNQVRALILTPTRELAAQVGESVARYGQHLPLRSAVVFGGVKINPQMMALRKGVDVLVATPGRLLDLYQQNAVNFRTLEILVLDEADRMLDMGFIHDIRKILALLPPKRQNLLFSATFSEEIRQLAKSFVKNPVEVSVSPPNSTVKSVEHWLCEVDKNQKPQVLIKLILENQWEQVLVFSRTKHGANRLAKQLEDRGIKAAAIHGNKSQGARTRALADFKQGAVTALVATDIAARGLDIDQLPYVVNVDLPSVPEDYVHRIGRTGRAGASGQAISLVCAEEFKQLKDIERLIGEAVTRKEVAGYHPQTPLPTTALNTRPPKPNKPKKPKQQAAASGNRSQEANRRPSTPAAGAKKPGTAAPGASKNRGNRHRDGQRSGEVRSGHRADARP